MIAARLINKVQAALSNVLQIQERVCWTDSKCALYWITNGKEHKQYVQNRVDQISALTKTNEWRHCPGPENPSDLGSRGSLPSELMNNILWWRGPPWIERGKEYWPRLNDELLEPNEDCLKELKGINLSQDPAVLLVNSKERRGPISVSNMIDCGDYPSYNRLLRVTAYVIKFIRILQSRTNKVKGEVKDSALTAADLLEAENLWIIDVQDQVKSDPRFKHWKAQLVLIQDEESILRSKGRLSQADLPYASKYPSIIPRENKLTELIVRDCHSRVYHCGVKDTLAELRTRFWIVIGRQYVKKVLSKCVVCRRLEGKSFNQQATSDLPDFRLQETLAFTTVGIDYAGPLLVKSEGNSKSKVWICLFSCNTSRGIHLEVVPDLTSGAFLRCLQRFTSRRGIPRLITSDNATTFKAASRILLKIAKSPEVLAYLASRRIIWRFLLEKAPWQGGAFEILIKLVKRTLKKILGQALLTYEELLTVVTDVEGTVNCRPITYLYLDERVGPLTPSHLITGKRIISLPSIVEEDQH